MTQKEVTTKALERMENGTESILRLYGKTGNKSGIVYDFKYCSRRLSEYEQETRGGLDFMFTAGIISEKAWNAAREKLNTIYRQANETLFEKAGFYYSA